MAGPAAPSTPTATTGGTTPAATHVTDAALYCPSCMYDLRGISSEVCPECGFKLDAESLNRSSIPWSYRKCLNRPWLMVKTAWRALRRPRLFCMALARPVAMRDARSFRLATICTVWLTTAVCWSLAVWDGASPYLELDYWEDEVAWLAEYEAHFEALADLGPTLVWFNAALGVLFWVWLYLVSGVQTYFAHRRGPTDELDSRAVALSYYACGPMLLFVFPASLMLASGYVYEAAQDFGPSGDVIDSAASVMFGASWWLILLVGLICLWNSSRFAGLLSGSGLGRQLITAALLPLGWLGLGLLVFGFIPGVALFLYFVFNTF